MRRGAFEALLVLIAVNAACDRGDAPGPIFPPKTLEEFVERSEMNRGKKRVGQLIAGFPAGSAERFERDFRRARERFLFLHRVHSLSVAQARVLATFEGDHITLPDLRTLGTQAARALARWNGKSLFLDGLASLDPLAALALSEFQGELISLSGLTRLDPEAAPALARFPGAVAVRVNPPAERAPQREDPAPEELWHISQAIGAGDVAAVQDYLRAGGPVEANLHGVGVTPLMEATKAHRPAIAEVLIKAGANVNAMDRLGKTPLMCALGPPMRVDEGPDESAAAVLALTRMLLEAGAQVNPAPPDRADENTRYAPPLTFAAKLGHLPAVRLLLERGADPAALDRQGKTAAEVAEAQGHPQVTAAIRRHSRRPAKTR